MITFEAKNSVTISWLGKAHYVRIFKMSSWDTGVWECVYVECFSEDSESRGQKSVQSISDTLDAVGFSALLCCIWNTGNLMLCTLFELASLCLDRHHFPPANAGTTPPGHVYVFWFHIWQSFLHPLSALPDLM